MIAVDAISLKRGTFLLSRVSLVIPERSYTVLMGPSGAGKTLFLETLAGVYPVSEGTVIVAGKDVTCEPPEKRGIGFVYQDYSLFPHLTVEDNVSYGLRMAGVSSYERKEKVHGLLDQFSILSLAHRYPGTLSGGEKQRVALARALATNPAALLLDEPFAALDPDTRESCMEEVKTIQQEQDLTILQVSHSREEAYLLADQVVIMDQGRILQAGPPLEVFSHPLHRTVANLAGFENIFEGVSGLSEEEKTYLSAGNGVIAAKGRFQEGMRYLVCIRSGDIAIDPWGVSRDGTVIEGRIVSRTITDQGYRVEIEGPFPLTVDIPRHGSPAPGYRPGDRVTARIAMEDVHLIPVERTPVGGVI